MMLYFPQKKSYILRWIILYIFGFFISSLFFLFFGCVPVWIYNDVLRQGDQKKKEKKFLMNLQSGFGSLSLYFYYFFLFLCVPPWFFSSIEKWGSSPYTSALYVWFIYIFKKRWKKNNHIILYLCWSDCDTSCITAICTLYLSSSSSVGSSELMNLLFCLDFLHFVCGFCFVLFYFSLLLLLLWILHNPHSTPPEPHLLPSSLFTSWC